MHTVEMLEQTLKLAEQQGYTIRQEWLGGRGGGPCEIRGSKVLFIDLALSPLEQLDQARLALTASQGATGGRVPSGCTSAPHGLRSNSADHNVTRAA